MWVLSEPSSQTFWIRSRFSNLFDAPICTRTRKTCTAYMSATAIGLPGPRKPGSAPVCGSANGSDGAGCATAFRETHTNTFSPTRSQPTAR